MATTGSNWQNEVKAWRPLKSHPRLEVIAQTQEIVAEYETSSTTSVHPKKQAEAGLPRCRRFFHRNRALSLPINTKRFRRLGLYDSRRRLDKTALKLTLAQEQSALARYEAEHREWSTETIAKMKKLSDDMLVDASKVAETDGKEAVDAFISGRKKELESLTVEMKDRLATIEAKSAEVESLCKQLGEIEDKLGVKPSAME